MGLYVLTRALLAVNITTITLAAYGMKIPYNDVLFLDTMTKPDVTTQIKYDIGRNVNTSTIPLFGFDHCVGTVFPMFGDLGAGYGSICISLTPPSNRIDSVTMKCYPRILHHIKAQGITMEMPGTNRGMKSKF